MSVSLVNIVSVVKEVKSATSQQESCNSYNTILTGGIMLSQVKVVEQILQIESVIWRYKWNIDKWGIANSRRDNPLYEDSSKIWHGMVKILVLIIHLPLPHPACWQDDTHSEQNDEHSDITRHECKSQGCETVEKSLKLDVL